MRKWSEFGDQVNRLVYTLAGCKFQTDIESANRFIAEKIFYSEVSVRMMRQGRFRPQEEKALETLVEIGCSQAGLEREWGSRLLYGGRHSSPETVLQRIYTIDSSPHPTTLQPASVSANPSLAIRLIGGLMGSIIALLVWMYLISPIYPARHELSVLMESIWGLLIGMGLAGGIVGADMISEKANFSMMKKAWPRCLVLPAAGLIGALFWNLIAAKIFSPTADSKIISTGLETISFGAVYGLAFGAATILARRDDPGIIPRLQPFAGILLFAAITGSFSLVGFILAKVQPSFANQKDVDIFVGLLLRASLVFTVGLFFPSLPCSKAHN